MKDVIPDQVRLNKMKRGFNASINSVLDRKDPKVIDRLLSSSPIFELLDRKAIENFIRNTSIETNSLSKFLFNFVSAKMFLEIDLVDGLNFSE